VAERVLAIDFGTCFSSAAVATADGDARVVPEPVSSSYAWPSAVFDDGTELLVGGQAEGRKRQDPAAYRAEFKRDLGQDEPIVLGSRSYLPQDLVSAVLAKLKAAAEQLTGDQVSRAVLTVPASYARGDPRRGLMVAAAQAAGLGTVELLAEPVAAVFAPVLGAALRPGELVLVYDFGGGTFDTALVQIGESRHEILGSAALDDCGGSDLDAGLVAKLTVEAEPWLAAALEAAPGDKQAARLRFQVGIGDLARGMKHQLSDTTRAEEFVIDSAPLAELSRGELETLAAPLLRQTMDCCRDLIRRLGRTTADLSAVLLVGGTTRMPIVPSTLADDLKVPLRQTADPDLAVVRGAAVWARTQGTRTVAPLPYRPGTALLRWRLAPAELLRWLIAPGQSYSVGTPLARVRLADGTIWDLTASLPGTFDAALAAAGDRIASGDWIAASTAVPAEGRPAG
jgi:molecular chaperone DnaK